MQFVNTAISLEGPSRALTRLARVRQTSERLAQFLREHEGIAARGRSPEDLTDFFCEATEAQQVAAVLGLETYYETCLDVVAHNKRLRNHSEAVGAHLLRHRVRIDHEVAGIMDRHECVEIYDFNLVQTYRSPNFLNFTDRSLEELAILPYYRMFTRSEEVSQRCITNAMAILTGSHQGPMWDFLNRHIVKERGSARVSSVNTIVSAPIYAEKGTEIMGLIHVFDIEAHNELTLVN